MTLEEAIKCSKITYLIVKEDFVKNKAGEH